MKVTIKNCLPFLKLHAAKFDAAIEDEKLKALDFAHGLNWKMGKAFLDYAELLLFMAAHPSSRKSLKKVERNLSRLGILLKNKSFAGHSANYNSGLPHSPIVTLFSHDLLLWMLNQKDLNVEIDSYAKDAAQLGDLLKITLPSLERDRTGLGYEAKELLEALRIKGNAALHFIVSQLSEFSNRPLLKDYLFESLGIYVSVKGKGVTLSKFNNRFCKHDTFFHHELLKKFDHLQLFNTALPSPLSLTEAEKTKLGKVIRLSLVLTARETDPSTYMDHHSLRLYELERGISVAIYGMTADRQLPLESYVGYTLFKNGFPCAYGGAWVFGKRAMFGMNIFEPYRGGESGYMMCQLLRVYRQVFGVSVFEVEPYQFGKDNPDGIKSGAFWFYYKYGFRPENKLLRKLAANEKAKIDAKRGYFSSYKVLEKFTESFVVLELESIHQPEIASITEKVTMHIARFYKGNRLMAKEKCSSNLLQSTKMDLPPSNALEEWSLVAAALSDFRHERLELIGNLVVAKNGDLYKYQGLLLDWLCQK